MLARGWLVAGVAILTACSGNGVGADGMCGRDPAVTDESYGRCIVGRQALFCGQCACVTDRATCDCDDTLFCRNWCLPDEYAISCDSDGRLSVSSDTPPGCRRIFEVFGQGFFACCSCL
jgi:hypothetical protein